MSVTFCISENKSTLAEQSPDLAERRQRPRTHRPWGWMGSEYLIINKHYFNNLETYFVYQHAVYICIKISKFISLIYQYVISIVSEQYNYGNYQLVSISQHRCWLGPYHHSVRCTSRCETTHYAFNNENMSIVQSMMHIMHYIGAINDGKVTIWLNYLSNYTFSQFLCTEYTETKGGWHNLIF